MTNSTKTITAEEIIEIAKVHGSAHADFVLEQAGIDGADFNNPARAALNEYMKAELYDENE